MISVSVLNFDEEWHHTETILVPLTMGRLRLGSHSDFGNANFKNNRVHLKYSMVFDRRKIQCHFKKFKDGKDLNVEIWLLQKPSESMCIATPWADAPKAFYYNQKINCMPASGCVQLGDEQWRFKPENSMGVLDWGRGVWTYDNTWYWGTGSGWIEGVPFGFNIGYGFSDRTSASENVLFYDGKIHKLSEVTLCIPQDMDGNLLYTEAVSYTHLDVYKRQTLLYRLTFNGQILWPERLLRKGPAVVAYDWFYNPQAQCLKDSVMAVNPYTKTGELRVLDKKHFRRIMKKYFTVRQLYRKRHKKVEAAYYAVSYTHLLQ